MKPTIKVTNKIPVPEPRTRWPELEVGESFFAAGKDHHQLAGVVANRKRRKGHELICRQATVGKVKGLRVWRRK